MILHLSASYWIMQWRELDLSKVTCCFMFMDFTCLKLDLIVNAGFSNCIVKICIDQCRLQHHSRRYTAHHSPATAAAWKGGWSDIFDWSVLMPNINFSTCCMTITTSAWINSVIIACSIIYSCFASLQACEYISIHVPDSEKKWLVSPQHTLTSTQLSYNMWITL